MADQEKLRRLLEIVRDEILPLTESEAAKGCGATGGAVLRSDTYTSVMIGSDSTSQSPLLHGEIDALSRYFKLPVRPDPSELIFLATHDPCPMCAAAIARSGIKELWYIFDSPENEHICEELFGAPRVREENEFFTKRRVADAIEEGGSAELADLLDEITKRYDALAPTDGGEEQTEEA